MLCWRRCWRRGGAAAKREGGWCGSAPRSGSDRGDFSPRREGASAFARTTSPHPPGRSLGSPTQLTCPSGVQTHTPDPDQPRTTPSLTTLLSPRAVERDFFASTFDFLASAPNDGLLLDEPGYLQVLRARVDAAPARSEKVRQHQRGEARAMGLRACACDVPCVACEERRCSPHDLEISRHGCTCAIQCRR